MHLYIELLNVLIQGTTETQDAAKATGGKYISPQNKVKSAVCTDYKTENKEKMNRIIICLAVDLQ